MTPRHAPLALLVLLAASSAAQAKSRAEALFDSGRALMAAQRYPEACSAFNESQSLEPAVGTLLNLADCQEHLGLPADAMVTFTRAAQLAEAAGQAKRASVARARASRLVPLVGTLELRADSSSELAVDDRALSRAEAEAGLTVNPGLHKVVADAPGGSRWVSTVGPVAAGKRLVVVVPSPSQDKAPASAQPSLSPSVEATPALARPESAASAPAPVAHEATALRHAAPVLVTGGGALVALGAVGIAHALSVSSAVSAQQPGGPNAGAPTVTRAEFQQLSWLYPASLGAAVLGAGLAGVGIYGFASNQGAGAGVAGHF